MDQRPRYQVSGGGVLENAPVFIELASRSISNGQLHNGHDVDSKDAQRDRPSAGQCPEISRCCPIAGKSVNRRRSSDTAEYDSLSAKARYSGLTNLLATRPGGL